QYKEQEQLLQSLTEKREAVKQKILQSQESLELLRAQSVEENRKLDACRNEHNLLKSLVDSLEGYPDSIKFLEKNKNWNTNAPLLSDIFVVQDAYRTALENVLDNYLNYYVVQNMEEAVQAIQLLEQHKKGKANFFLMDQFPHAATAEKNDHPDITGVVRAMDVVSADAAYLPLATALLGNIYIVPDAASLQQIPLQPGAIRSEERRVGM